MDNVGNFRCFDGKCAAPADGHKSLDAHIDSGTVEVEYHKPMEVEGLSDHNDK